MADDGAKSIDGEAYTLRSYQTEMVEASLKQNIIVAMDTGSGKTAIAVARAEAALEAAEHNEIVWLLAPTVALCRQHKSVFEKYLARYQSRLLTGSDGVDKWTNQSTWDEALLNQRIVISTESVLLDALSHAFVKMSQITLLIFDEAHRCLKKHPSVHIMYEHYFPSSERPRILGLTASPEPVAILEANLNSRVFTPTQTRTELSKHVHRPTLENLVYSSGSCEQPLSLRLLCAICRAYNLDQDPYILSIRNMAMRNRAILKKKTYCLDQLKLLQNSSMHISGEIGSLAADWFIQACVSRYLRTVQKHSQQLASWLDSEKIYLAQILERLSPPTHAFIATPMQHDQTNRSLYSPKTESLFNLLLDEWSEEFTGIIFVKQRAAVIAMTELLSSHPLIGPRFRIRGVVGESNSSQKKKNITELLEPKAQQTALDDFRKGLANLIVCTNALQEGIDVPNCHIVVCFDPPPNLVSFVQRRGRARKSQSKYIILHCEDDYRERDWATLEKRLEEVYQDECRISAENERLEQQEDEENRGFREPTTGAILNLDNAVAHLFHFCATLNAGSYVDPRPQISFQPYGTKEVIAEIALPLTVDPSLRVSKSSRPYRTERTAKKDAAYEAYLSLYRAGLINSNLLPLKTRPDDTLSMEDKASIREGPPQFDPWPAIAAVSNTTSTIMHKFLVTVSGGGDSFSMTMCSPDMPLPSTFNLYWNRSTQYQVFVKHEGNFKFDEAGLETARRITKKVLHAAHGTRMLEEHDDFLTYFLPIVNPESSIKKNDWTRTSTSFAPLQDGHQTPDSLAATDFGIVMYEDIKYLFKRFVPEDPEQLADAGATKSCPGVIVSRYPKRRDFLHPVTEPETVNAYTTEILLPFNECLFGDLPRQYAIFSLFIPSILRRFELASVAKELNSTLLKPVGFQNLDLVQRAITHNAAREEENYQKLEFLGDCILKLFTSVQLMVDHPTWPEGYLTHEKSIRVSNTTLDAITRRIGLDKFIISRQFAGAKWRPLYIHEVLKNRELVLEVSRSSKMLADVIESLIGASYIDDGLDGSLRCIKIFFPTDHWLDLAKAMRHLHSTATEDESSPPHLENLEKLLGYTFKSPQLLLEPMTHASFTSYRTATARSYERVEFLGDAILDFLVVRRLFAHKPDLNHITMHTVRTAMVNSDILGYLCMTHSVDEIRHDPIMDEGTGAIKIEETAVKRWIWQYMRHTSQAISDAQTAAMDRLNGVSHLLATDLESGTRYPWSTLAHFAPDKFFSDIIESVIGAIFVDSCGSLSACDAFVRDLGLWKLLDRILADEVDCLHPKERLGQLAIEKKVNYGQPRIENGMYFCTVKVGDKQIGEEVKGISRLDAENAAAVQACKILQGKDLELDEV